MSDTASTIAMAGLCVTCLTIMAAFIRRQAVVETEHKWRLVALEKSHDGLARAIDRLTDAVTRLDRKLAVTDARASQGQFGDTEPPPR